MAGSLLNWSVTGDKLIMHRLLGLVLRERDLTAGRWPQTIAICLDLLEPRLFDHQTGWGRREEGNDLVTQIAAVFANTPEDSSIDLVQRLLQARSWAVKQLSAASDLSRAITLGKEVASDYERILGNQNPFTFMAWDDAAYALLAADQHGANPGCAREAVALYERTGAERRRVFGERHPDTITSQYNLAYAYYCAHRWGESIPLYKEVVAARGQMLGSRHPDTIKARHGLGSAYIPVHRLNEGITLLSQTLKDCEEVLGSTHPDTLAVCRSLGIAYFTESRISGRWIPEALSLLKRTLDGRKQVLGGDHPETIASLLELGVGYFRSGNEKFAARIFRDTVAISERVLGPDHPNTIIACHNLEGVAHLIIDEPPDD